MRINHSLSDNAQLILRIAVEDEEPVKLSEFYKKFHFAKPYEQGFSEAMKIFSGPFKSTTPAEEKKEVLQELIGLSYLGFVVENDTPFSSFSASSTSIANITVGLSSEGRRIGTALKEKRRLVFRPNVSFQNTIFIACAFGFSEIDELTDRYFIPASANLGYRPVRIDMSEPESTITERMMREITQSAAMLADLTHARPSVYFEIGYAHGLGIPIVLTCRKDHHSGVEDSKRVHFDLQQYKISYWDVKEDEKISWEKITMTPEYRLGKILEIRK